MRYASAAAFRQALEARLVALSRDGGLSLVRLRKSVAFDRLLARLFAVAPDRWVLKGGLALDYRLGTKARTTMDIDLAGPGDEDAAAADLQATGELDLGDHFSFAIERTAKLDQLVEGSAVRYHVRADLAGRLFEEFLLDVGFDFRAGWEPETLNGPDLLAFAGIEPVEAPSLALELQIAEKVHAYTRGAAATAGGMARAVCADGPRGRTRRRAGSRLRAGRPPPRSGAVQGSRCGRLGARGSRLGGTIEPGRRLRL